MVVCQFQNNLDAEDRVNQGSRKNRSSKVSKKSTRSSKYSCCKTYKEYQEFVAKELRKRLKYPATRAWINAHFEKLLFVFLLNFDSILPLLRSLYACNPRRKPYDPQIILRSLLLMIAFGETSITKWVKRLKGHPLLAIFAGTTPNRIPCVGTHYEFMKRLENGAFISKSKGRILASDMGLLELKTAS